MLAVWLQDRRSPFYLSSRVGSGERIFRMVKLRSMVVGADSTGVMSTGANDRRITAVGHVIRRYKLDELTQLWNVLLGDMSMVGPRPNVKAATDLYTLTEKQLLTMRPGITDFASIVFADEGEILRGFSDPDLAYEQLIHRWKIRLGLFYVERWNLSVDLRLIWLTARAIVDRKGVLQAIQALLSDLGAEADLVEIAGRTERLVPIVPSSAEVGPGRKVG